LASVALNLSAGVIDLGIVVVLAPEGAGLVRSLAGRVGQVDAGVILVHGIVIVVDVDEVASGHVSAGRETVYQANKKKCELVGRSYDEKDEAENVQQSSSDKMLVMKSFFSLRTAAVRFLNSRMYLSATLRLGHIPLASGVELEGVGD
jgi:hypothetical protein